MIPFRENHCVNTQYGGYFTSPDRDGSVYNTEKFMWMQWWIRIMRTTPFFVFSASSGFQGEFVLGDQYGSDFSIPKRITGLPISSNWSSVN